ncbi:uncharacterized protein LOC131206703 isoform X1 [Anopheles bellator]|uniref:uncharacterized protein LOC131206703 isoform X1 n=1 Tax=Anopheles bellator TaxID=139047 RepID=UPI0026487EAA|nr:uncharacterized protein LOC131206703 isoform X1 [Anopheles bellator]
MTAESLKPFLNAPNELKTQCAQKSSPKCLLTALGCAFVAILCCTLIGVEIWHLNMTEALQQEVEDLKVQLKELNSMQRAGDFNDYEFDNELFDNPDEYETGYESHFDGVLSESAEDGMDATEMLDSGSSSRALREEDEEGEEEALGGRPEEVPEGPREDEEDLHFDDGVEDISVSVSEANGKRRIRSISGLTQQGVPIVDEPYVPRRNRSRRPHRIFEQMRQRPEELVTPPPSVEMFRWDVDGSSRKPASHHASSQQQYGSISIRPFHHSVHGRLDQYSTTPAPEEVPVSSTARHHSRHSGLSSTKAPALVLNRHSRVQVTGDVTRAQLQQQRFPKVVGNPGTQNEVVMKPERRMRLRQRKTGLLRQDGEPRARSVHLVQVDTNTGHHLMRLKHWVAKDESSKQSIAARLFRFNGEELEINDPGIYYVYAQITYDNEHDINGFHMLVNGESHIACSVQARHGNTISTCHTAGLLEVSGENGVKIVIEDFAYGRQFLRYPEKTFFGAFKIGNLPPHANRKHSKQ